MSIMYSGLSPFTQPCVSHFFQLKQSLSKCPRRTERATEKLKEWNGGAVRRKLKEREHYLFFCLV